MRAKVVGLVAVLAHVALQLQAPQTADACGVPMKVKANAQRKAVARTSRPSPVLLVGTLPSRLGRDLTQAGHQVDKAPTPQSAKSTAYTVVIVDSEDQAAAARQRFAKATVIVNSGNVPADIASVEDRVARRPKVVASVRPPVDVKPERPPIDAGPKAEPPKEPLRAKTLDTPAESPPAPAPTPAAPANVTAAPARPEVRTKPEARAEAKAVALHQEVFFGLGSAKVGNAQALSRAVTWLTTNASASVTLEGHADPTGAAASNLVLSQSRAEAVRDFLVGKGIDAARIEIKALGDTQLEYGRTDGRNRRVAIDAKP